MSRLLPGILAMAAIVVASNILVQHLLGQWLTWGAITYPLAFLVTDVMNRVYGPGAARRVIFAGFIVGILCSLVGTQIMLQGDGYSYAAVATRIAVSSALAFLIAQMVDVAIFDRLRHTGKWWSAPLVSSIIGSALDTLIFFTIGFAEFITFFGENADAQVNWAWESVPFLNVGPDAPLWISLAFADWMVKLLLAMIALLPFRAIVAKMTVKAA